jgi:hypothetical protein
MQITFPGAKAKFIRITQTGAVAPGRSPFWSIHELELLQPGGTVQREVQSRAN